MGGSSHSHIRLCVVWCGDVLAGMPPLVRPSGLHQGDGPIPWAVRPSGLWLSFWDVELW